MIIASLLLILVAVTLLVLGLAGGSSTLLISSIVASLLAAVALVVGARQAGAGRRATGDPLAAGTPPTPAGSSVPGSAAYDDPAAYAGAPLRAGSAGGDPLPHPESPADAGSGRRGGAPDGAYNDGSAESGHVRREGEPDPERVIREAFSSREADRKAQAAGSPYDDEAPSAPTGAGHSDSEPDRAAAYAAGQRDAVTGLTGSSRTAAGPGPDVTQRVDTDTDAYAGPGDSDAGVDRVPYSGTDADSTAAGGRRPPERPTDPDYDQASSMIGGARATDDDSWRRTPADPDPASFPDRPADQGTPFPESTPAADRAGPYAEPSRPGEAFADPAPPGDRGGAFADPGRAAEQGAALADPARGGDFGEPDPDDPDDEPLPQKVRPADAVRVARMDAEVLVVDGRPRYHLAGCPHLAGRETEGLPVAEAVELGFSPCGQCRPVDRLVAATLHH